jgi:deoxyribose-phosphate aldolase
MDLAHLIDHTLLKPDCNLSEIKVLCEEAKTHHFASVCIPPYYVKDATHLLEGSEVKVSTVIGFPMGYSSTPSKVEEIKRAIDEGADEMDAVVNICAVKNRNWNFVRNEMESLTTACHMRGKVLKIILETGLMSEPEIIKLCEITAEVKVDFAKTSTGYSGHGAAVATVALMRKVLPPAIKIKASGGIRDRQFAEQLVLAGANRLGSSSGVSIVTG